MVGDTVVFGYEQIMKELTRDLKQIGGRMYAIRSSHGWTQEDVAVAAGISVRNYAEIERGRTNLRIITMIGICEALNVMPDDLISKEKVMVAIEI